MDTSNSSLNQDELEEERAQQIHDRDDDRGNRIGGTHHPHRSDWQQQETGYGQDSGLRYVGSTTGWYLAPSFDDAADDDIETVYILHAPEVGKVKIGYTSQLATRLSSIRSQSPVAIVLERTLDGGHSREQYLHEEFKNYRLHGEWFSDEVLDLLPSQ